ncbi:MAG: flagellar biosynthesis protein FlhA [Syntrophales bacterium]|jgi:flagellar biosynthesis protein FlhA|nr:flagellar biosynthesis protein FlhA [Syntrophales bacterium]
MATTGTTQNAYTWDWLKSNSAIVALAVIGILAVMVVPLHKTVLDILLSFNIAVAMIILLMAMYVLKPLDFSVFPSVLLIATLFRLALNVASTRIILLRGGEGTDAAGQVIKAFGTFVVGGNYVVGMIVFAVLVLINFIVITKGSTRIAEVAARFTLDAMPGKQMSIDADLNAGMITDLEARHRRGEVEKEANFYGAMDGASKFVRGDAVAGIIIVLINIIGGLIVGVLQNGMTVVEAARNYTLLTVGDGLVTQVPALIVSTAAGMLVTRNTASTDLGGELQAQLFMHPRAIATAAAMLFIFGLIPGMPKLAFFMIALIMAGLAVKLYKTRAVETEIAEEDIPEAPPSDTQELFVPVDPLGLEVGYGLISLVDASQGGELLQRIKMLRKQLAMEMGFVMPAIHIRDNLQLKPNGYSFLMKGVEIARGELMPGHHLVITADETGPKIQGIETREPAFGLPAVWIPEREKESVQARGLIVVDPATVITTHMTEIVKNHADELLGRQEVQNMLDQLSQTYPRVVDELVPKVVPLGVLQKVLQRLLRERISVRNLMTIIEMMADYVAVTKNVDILTGYVRQSLARVITKQYEDAEGHIHVMMVSPEIEDIINRSIQHTEFESFVSPDPNMVSRMVGSLQKGLNTFTSQGLQPIVLCSPTVRIHLRNILERFFPNMVVLSHNEISREASIRSLGMVEL